MTDNTRNNQIDLRAVAFDKYKAVETMLKLDLSDNIELLHLDELFQTLLLFSTNDISGTQSVFQKVQELKERSDKISLDRFYLEQEIASLESDLARKTCDYSNLEQTKRQLELQLSDYRNQHHAINQEVGTLQQSIDEFQELVRKREQLLVAVGDNEHNRKHIEQDIVELEQKLSALPQYYKEQVSRKEMLTSKVLKDELRVDDISGQIHSLIEHQAELDTKSKRLSEELSERERQVSLGHSKLTELQTQMSDIVKRNASQEQQLEFVREKLQQTIEDESSEAQDIKQKQAFFDRLLSRFSQGSVEESNIEIAEYRQKFCTTEQDRVLFECLEKYCRDRIEMQQNREMLMSMQDELQDKIDVINQEYKIKTAGYQEGLAEQLEALRDEADGIIRQFKHLGQHFNKLGAIE